MKTDKKPASKNKKEWASEKSKKIQKVTSVSTTSKKATDSSDANVSVFTRTTNPKVIIQSESIGDMCSTIWTSNCHRHKLLKFLCLIIMCSIILITFFLSLKTYNIVHELSQYLS